MYSTYYVYLANVLKLENNVQRIVNNVYNFILKYNLKFPVHIFHIYFSGK